MYQHAKRKSKGWRHAPLGGNSTPPIEHFHEGNIGLHVERSPPTTCYVVTSSACWLRLVVYFKKTEKKTIRQCQLK